MDLPPPPPPDNAGRGHALWGGWGRVVDLGVHVINSYYYYMRQMGINYMQLTFWTTCTLKLVIFGRFLRENNYLQQLIIFTQKATKND